MSKIIRTVIVDDELLGRDALSDLLNEIEEIKVVQECSNGFEAVKAVTDKKPDLLFLDVQMPKLDGFDVVELLGTDLPIIVFVTAYDEYALQAFDAEALDYLLKPVNRERLHKTINRVKEKLNSKHPDIIPRIIDSHRNQNSPLSRILIRDKMEVTIVPCTDIVYFEAQDDYVMIVTENGSFLKSERLANLEHKLDSQYFCRIHRSYLINIKYLKKIEPLNKDKRLAVLAGKKNLPISRQGYKKLLEIL